MKKLVISLALVAGVLTGCFSETKTAAYFIKNKTERENTLAKCRTDKDSNKDENCINAFKADAQIAATEIDIKAISRALEMYKIQNSVYPTQEQGLKALVNKPTVSPIPKNYAQGGYLEQIPKDPWGNDYQYQNKGLHNDIDVYSYGVDGKTSKNEDGETVIGNW